MLVLFVTLELFDALRLVEENLDIALKPSPLLELLGISGIATCGCLDAGADIFECRLVTQLSPLQKLTLPVESLDAMKVPQAARFYAYFYPCEQLMTELLNRREDASWNSSSGLGCYLNSLQSGL